MVRDDNFYSNLVGILKVTLPLAALALLSTVFLLARAPSHDSEIPYAEIEEIAREPHVAGALMTGVADDGAIVELTSRTTRPDGDVIHADSVVAQIDTVEGHRIDIYAGQGEMDNTTNVARLFNFARLESSNGYEMESAGFMANLTTGRIESEGPLEIQAPFGTLTAGLMIIETPAGSDGELILFQNGVRLIYLREQ